MNDPNAAFDGETEPVGMFCEHRGEIACLRQAAGCAQDSAEETSSCWECPSRPESTGGGQGDESRSCTFRWSSACFPPRRPNRPPRSPRRRAARRCKTARWFGRSPDQHPTSVQPALQNATPALQNSIRPKHDIRIAKEFNTGRCGFPQAAPESGLMLMLRNRR